MIKHTEEFKQEAVRIALTSGLPRDRVASDLGIGKSTLGKWLAQCGGAPAPAIKELPFPFGSRQPILLLRLSEKAAGLWPASVETFFKSLKAELIWRQSWPTRRQAEAAIFQSINGFYNTRRRHS